MISIKTPSGSDSAIKKLTADYDAQTKAIQQFLEPKLFAKDLQLLKSYL